MFPELPKDAPLPQLIQELLGVFGEFKAEPHLSYEPGTTEIIEASTALKVMGLEGSLASQYEAVKEVACTLAKQGDDLEKLKSNLDAKRNNP